VSFYSVRPVVRDAIRRPPRPSGPNLYEPGTPGYEERHRETTTELPGGLLRIDLGEPPARLSCEGPAVTRKASRSAPVLSSPEPEPTNKLLLPKLLEGEPTAPRRSPWGLNKDGR